MSARRTRTTMLVAAVVLVLGGVSAVGVALAHQEPAPPAARTIPADPVTPSVSATPSASSTTSRPKARAKPTKPTTDPRQQELSESVPTRIQIPSIKVDADFVDLGLLDNGEMETPSDPDQAGWFVGAHTPGAPGVAVVAGHVTWNRRPTVFFKLGELDKGAKIVVTRKDGSRATFAVDRMSTFPKDSFPTKEVYQDSPVPELTLITCGGVYDNATHSYGSNTIVWTKLVSTRPA